MADWFARARQRPKHLNDDEFVPTNKEIVSINRPLVLPTFWLPKIESDCFPNYRIIEEINDEFNTAVGVIRSQNLISLSAEGINLGRHGTLCWLAIMVDEQAYLFDIVHLKSAAFDHGLKDILESERIEKIIFDSTFLSDYLIHAEKITLRKVFDVQAAQVVLWRYLHGGDSPLYFDSFLSCVQNILKDDVNKIPILWCRVGKESEDKEVWKNCRPLSKQLEQVLVASVMKLPALRRTLCETMLSDFYRASDIKLRVASEETDRNARLLKKYPRRVPAAFKHLDDDRNELLAALERTGQRIETTNDVKGPLASAWITDQRWNLRYLRYSKEAWRAIRILDKDEKEMDKIEQRTEQIVVEDGSENDWDG